MQSFANKLGLCLSLTFGRCSILVSLEDAYLSCHLSSIQPNQDCGKTAFYDLLHDPINLLYNSSIVITVPL